MARGTRMTFLSLGRKRETVLRKDINTAIEEVNYSKDNVPLRASLLKHVLNHILGGFHIKNSEEIQSF